MAAAEKLPVEIAGLRYFDDNNPGICRRRAGRGFRYIDKDGNGITDPQTLDRIGTLAIPPAWTDVWISPARLKAKAWASLRDIVPAPV